MVTVSAKPKLTYEDYLNTPDDVRYELLDGELVPMSPTPIARHQRLVFNIAHTVRLFVDEHDLGEVFISPFDVILSETIVVQPDVMFVSKERLSIVEDYLHGAPDLVVEVLSPSTSRRDRTIKREFYERHGVKEYWLVDPYGRNVTVLLLGERGYDVAGVYGADETLTSPTLAGFALDLSEVF